MARMFIGYFIKSINDKLKAKNDAALKRFHLTFTQSRVLAFLDEHGSQATQKDIEVFLGVSHPTVVGIVTRMEQNGHVTTWIDRTDKRNKMVKLTETALSICNEMKNDIAEGDKKILASLSENEVAELQRMLQIIYHNLH